MTSCTDDGQDTRNTTVYFWAEQDNGGEERTLGSFKVKIVVQGRG